MSVASAQQAAYGDGMTNTNQLRPNRYAGRCNGCGQHVEAMTGVLLGRMVGGSRRWVVRHRDGDCYACPAPRVLEEDHPCQVHGPGDDECLGSRCVTGRRPAVLSPFDLGIPSRQAFDADRRSSMYREACRLFRIEDGMRYIPFLDRQTDWGDVSEMMMHAQDAWLDAQDGRD